MFLQFTCFTQKIKIKRIINKATNKKYFGVWTNRRNCLLTNVKPLFCKNSRLVLTLSSKIFRKLQILSSGFKVSQNLKPFFFGLQKHTSDVSKTTFTYSELLLFFFYIINMSVRVNLHTHRLILRALKLTII